MKKRSRNRKNRNQSWSSQRRWFVQTRASCSAIIVKRMTSRMLAASGLTRIAVAMRDVSEALLSEKKDYSTRRCIYRRTRRLCIRSIIVVKTSWPKCKVHIKAVYNSERPYFCEEFGKAFGTKDAFNEHQVTHIKGSRCV
uniref:(northern house mosquito) hypothetical protein n=1 Tax=Culex pipiens TaxID=7175 RepID=A0A8D8MQG4_CULPI